MDAPALYRVMLVVWQYVKLGQYTTCLDLLGLLGFWLTGQSKWADWLNLSTQPNCQTTSIPLYKSVNVFGLNYQSVFRYRP